MEKGVKQILHSLGESFRGQIYENARRFRLIGKAYESIPREQDGYFDIQSARQLEGPLRGLLDFSVRMVFIIGATQVLKSVVGDIWIPYLLEHDLRNILVLFETDAKALVYCDTRFMDTIKRHPVLSPLLSEVNRHDVTKTEIKFAGAKLIVGGLNDSNVSSLSWPILWISEAWQHGTDGLLWKAFKRTDRFPNDHKILCESQASVAGADLHVASREAHQVPLTWECPACSGRQTWEWKHWNFKRPEDFTPREQKTISTFANGSGIISETPKANSYAGMKFLDDGGGTNSVRTRAESAYWECIWCGHRIDDKSDIRQKIMDSYIQDYRITKNGILTAPPKLTFTLPFEAARDNRFSSTVESFLIAKHEERQGSNAKLALWFMAERAVFFSEEMLKPEIRQITEAYDPEKAIENEHHKGMTIDCQKHKTLDTVGTFHYSVDAADKNGNSFELARGFAESWEEWIAVQKKFKIPNHCVNIDGRKWTPEILRMAAAHRELAKGIQFGREIKYWSCWNVLLGDAPARHYLWPDKQHRVWSPPTRRVEFVIENGKRIGISVFMYRWSNLSVKDQLHEILIGGEGKPKFVALPRSALLPKDQLIEVGDMTYDAQMSAEQRTEKYGRPSWEKISNRPNHRWDVACMRLLRLLMKGLIGYIAAPEETKPTQ